MKRLLSFLLAVVLLLGCGVAAVSAENSKLLPDLQEALKTMEPDDEIGLYICYNVPMVTVADMPSWPEIYEARKEYFAFTAKRQAEIQAIIFDGIDVEIGFEGVDDMVLAHVKVSDVEKIASYDIVRDIDYYPTGILEEPMTDGRIYELWEKGELPTAEDIAEAVNSRGFEHHNPISADQITVTNAYRFNCTPAYVVDYEIEGMGYYLCVEWEQYYFGKYLLYLSSSYEPSIFVNDTLYRFSEAYQSGILTEEMLAELVKAEYKGGNYGGKCRLITRNIKGDADGSGEVDIIDATCIQRYDTEIIGADRLYKPLGDVDGDGEATITDATCIQRYELGLYEIG